MKRRLGHKLSPKKRAALVAQARKYSCSCKGKGCPSCS
jgi:hypothetical protein